MRRAPNQATWYPAERGSRSRMATVAAGVDFLAQQTESGRWELSAWDAKENAMRPVRAFDSFSELRDHVDLNAPEYARFNRQAARARSGRVANQEDYPAGTLVAQTRAFRKSIGSVTKGPVDGLVLGSRDERLLVAWSDGHAGQIHAKNVRKTKKQLSPDLAHAYVDEAVRRLPSTLAHSFTPEEVELVKAEYGIGERQTNQGRVTNMDPSDPDYHLRNLSIDPKLALRALDWHGGQSSMLYSLGSTAYAGHLVSPSMIDAAVGELEQARSWKHVQADPALVAELDSLIAELDAISRSPEEYVVEDDQGHATWLMSNPAPKDISGPLRMETKRDGLWVVGRGVAVPVNSKKEGHELMERLSRRPNGPGATMLTFHDVPELGEALEVMDVALRPSRMERPTVFRVDWGAHAVVLEGDPDDPGVSQAIRALEQADVHFDVDALPIAANPKGGTRGKAAGYAYLGQWIGSLLGFGLGAIIGGLAGALAAGAPGAVLGGAVAGLGMSYGGGIYGAWKGAHKGAPTGTEGDAGLAAAIGAGIPYLNWFMAPLAAYLATAPKGAT